MTDANTPHRPPDPNPPALDDAANPNPAGPHGPHRPSDPTAQWEPLDLDGLRARLVEVKDLLEQAAAAGLAQDVDRLEALSKLAGARREDGHAPDQRRRYR